MAEVAVIEKDNDSSLIDLLEDDGTFKQFLEESFDAKTYANGIIQARIIGEALAKLADGVSLLDKELHDQVASHHEDLLSQATGIETLEGVLQSIQTRIHSLKMSVDRVQTQIVEPYNRISSRTAQLRRLQNACDILRRVIRILYLSKRLQVQLKAGVREIAKAAQSLNELDYVLEGVDLSGIQVIEEDLRRINNARNEVERQAKQMLEQGLESQNQTQTGTALQVFHNLGILQNRVEEFLDVSKHSLQENMRDTLDAKQLSASQGSSQGPGRSTLPIPGNTAAWRAALWTRMEKLMNTIYSLFEKVYHLEKVLAKKRDPVTHICFIDTFSQNGRSVILCSFWNSTMGTLAKELNKAVQESTFLKQAFEGEYPKLLRVYNDLWERLQQFAGNQGTTANVSSNFGNPSDILIGLGTDRDGIQSPRQMLKEPLCEFEGAYLARSLSRLFDPINLVFPTGAQAVPSKEELNSIIKSISSELSVASVDADLLTLVARNVSNTTQLYVNKCEQLVVTDLEACQLSGGLTNAQILNASVINSLYQLHSGINQMLPNLSNPPMSTVVMIQASLQNVVSLMEITITLLLGAVQSSLENKIARIHVEDFSVSSPLHQTDCASDAACSTYIKDIMEFISRVQGDYFTLYECKDFLLERLQPVAGRLLVLFVRHACLLRDISESGKLKLAADMAQLEFAVAPLCKRISDLGYAYKILRAFRPLLFQSMVEILSNTALGDTLPYSTVMHFLFSMAPPELKSPHTVAGWTISEYSAWLDEHPEEEKRLALIRGTLEAYGQNLCQGQKEPAEVYKVMTKLLDKANV